jgi:AcrR family transcriptional regulator
MPPRPSRNLDQALLAAGRALFPERGCTGLALREVAEAAGVNLGMFHYHFGSRDAFLRALMQQAYEEMFATLTLDAGRAADPVANLRAGLRVLGRFLRDNRPFISRVLADALAGEECAREFLRDNMPRHIGVLHRFIVEGQQAGRIVPLASAQVLATCVGALAMALIFGGALAQGGSLPPAMSKMIQDTLLTDAAIDERIDLALCAITRGVKSIAKPRVSRKKKPRGKP